MGPGALLTSYRQVLAVGLPLVVSMGTTTLMIFTDRMFLGNYSVDAIAAAMPAGIASFVFIAFFMGVATYANAFIAQYLGAGRPQRVGAALWQAIYFCLLAAGFLAGLYFVAEPLFAWAGHPPEVRRLEVAYFRILTLGAGFMVLGQGLACFYSGRGLTRPVMLVNLCAAAVNIPLDYALINGVGFLPELGIVGAGLATVTAWALGALLFAIIVFTPEHNRQFAVWTARAFDRRLFGRLMRYGLPGGVQFFIQVSAFTFFVFMVGRLGKTDLAATNIVFAIDTLAFLPMYGLSVAVNTLVGQAVGRRRPEQAVAATTATLHITLAYMGLVALIFLLVPGPLMDVFQTRSLSAAQYEPIRATGMILLRFAAAYSLFDGLAIILSGAIKGAGDTHYVMWAMAASSLGVIVLPVYLGVNYLGFGVYLSWLFATVYLMILALLLWRRYRGGKWQSMRVIEAAPGWQGV